MLILEGCFVMWVHFYNALQKVKEHSSPSPEENVESSHKKRF